VQIFQVEFVGFFWNLPMIVSPVENFVLGEIINLFAFDRLKVTRYFLVKYINIILNSLRVLKKECKYMTV
jgi:hypothetical protein